MGWRLVWKPSEQNPHGLVVVADVVLLVVAGDGRLQRAIAVQLLVFTA